MEALLEKFNRLRKEEKWIEAAEVAMVLRDQYPNVDSSSVRWKMQYTEEKRKELEKRGEEDRKVAFWVGMLKYVGCGGYEQDPEAAYVWWSRAAAAGHVEAIFWKASLLWDGQGVTQDREAALRCYEEAGVGGHKYACYWTSEAHKNAQRYFQAALWYQRGAKFGNRDCDIKLKQLKLQIPMDICPWGVWRPDHEYHSLVLPKVQKAVRTTLLLFKRLGISKDMAKIVCQYVVTRSGWENK